MPLKLVRRKGSRLYYIRGTVRGQVVFETAGTDDAATAEAIRIKREGELLQRSVFGAGATVTFPQAALSYIEDGGEAKHLGRYDEQARKWTLLIGHFVKAPLARIGQNEIDEAARKLYPTAGTATRKRHVYVPMCAVLNHAARKGWCGAPKIRHPRVKQTPVEWATPDWMNKVLPHCAPRLRRLMVVLCYTGARLSEALRLTWDDIDLQHRRLVLRRTKNGDMRTAHIPDALLLELASVAENERHGPLFAWSDKRHVYRPIRTACRNAKMPYLSPHKFGRHTFATWLRLYAKRDLRGLMEDGGWDSIASVARYAHTVPGETAKAVDALPAVQNPSTSEVRPLKDRRMRKKIAWSTALVRGRS